MTKLILTINPDPLPCTGLIDRTSEEYWTASTNMSWDGTQWDFDSFNSTHRLDDTGSPQWVLGFRPSIIIVTYGVPMGDSTHDWIFELLDTGGGTIAFSGLISDPGIGTFTWQSSLDFSASLDIQALEISAGTGGNPPTFASGFINGIEFCP